MGYAQSNGLEIHFEVRGEGPPLLLLMGLGADGSVWEQHAREYERRFRCTLVDNRGAGRSDKPDGPYTTGQMAVDALAVMDAMGVDRAHVAGISMGGAIAQRLALLAPERIRSLTLNCSWSACDPYARRIFESLRSAVGVLDDSAFTRLLQLIIFSPGYHERHLDDLLRREKEGSKHPYPMPVHAFRAQCDACISHDTQGELAAITAPTLITVGDRDIFTPLHLAQGIHREISGSKLVVFEGAGHTHHWEQLKRFNELTMEFMLQN
jgi:pimeloyl-ACP methyl ester carboxylesterase